MSQSPSKIRRRLVEAAQDRVPVTVRRKHLDCDETSGFVIALTDLWVVLHQLDGVYLDDVVALRLDEVTKVEPHRSTAFVARAIIGLGEPIVSLDCPANASVSDLLQIATERGGLLGVHLERPDRDQINYGKVVRIGAKRLDLHYIRSDGVWVDYVEAWRLEEITRIEFGGRYIAALERFGDPRVPVVSRRKR